MIEFMSVIMLVFGVLQIILFFKLWGMTNDIRDIKNKYLKDNHKSTVENNQMPTPKNNESVSKKNINKEQEYTLIKDEQAKDIDIENEDFKKLIDRWRSLKKKGFIQQAINEYTEKTSLSIEDAKEFINDL